MIENVAVEHEVADVTLVPRAYGDGVLPPRPLRKILHEQGVLPHALEARILRIDDRVAVAVLLEIIHRAGGADIGGAVGRDDLDDLERVDVDVEGVAGEIRFQRPLIDAAELQGAVDPGAVVGLAVDLEEHPVDLRDVDVEGEGLGPGELIDVGMRDEARKLHAVVDFRRHLGADIRRHVRGGGGQQLGLEILREIACYGGAADTNAAEQLGRPQVLVDVAAACRGIVEDAVVAGLRKHHQRIPAIAGLEHCDLCPCGRRHGQAVGGNQMIRHRRSRAIRIDKGLGRGGAQAGGLRCRGRALAELQRNTVAHAAMDHAPALDLAGLGSLQAPEHRAIDAGETP